jgi:hypothetical protein
MERSMVKTLKEWEAFSVEKFANWLIECHGAHESSRKTIELNLQTQYDRCSLEGQLVQATERPQVTVNFSLFGKKDK